MNRTTKSTNCDAAVNGNQGCGVQVNKWSSYGPGFNNNGGGIYAMERTNEYIKVFFWPRNDDSLPLDIRSKSNVINTDNWVRVILNRNRLCSLTIFVYRDCLWRTSLALNAISDKSSDQTLSLSILLFVRNSPSSTKRFANATSW